jgi:pimeloyl-ACP methyl ester carboxylesterase
VLPLLLVHGGGCGSWCWEPLAAHVRAPCCTVDLPPVAIRGVPAPVVLPAAIEELRLADWADAVLAAAGRDGIDRFVLVGHSLGGLTICEVARWMPERVAHLVFVSALVPPEGANAIDALSPEMLERVAGGLTPAVTRDMFANDLDDAQTQFLLEHMGTEVLQMMTEPVSRAGLPDDLPRTYVRLARDRALTPSAQDASIAALGGAVDVVELDTGHMIMISRPDLLASVLDEIAAAST